MMHAAYRGMKGWGLRFFCSGFFVVLLVACGSSEQESPVAVSSLSEPLHTAMAVAGERMEWLDAVGTVRPRTESSLESRLAAQIKEIRVHPGSSVSRGDLLILLDDGEVRARMEQAKGAVSQATAARREVLQAIASADAVLEAARLDYERITGFLAEGAATRRDMEQATAVFHQAKAHALKTRDGLTGADAVIRQAEEKLRETEIAHGYTEIRAPESGEVLKRLVEPGDMAVPGRHLLVVQTSGFLRLEAYVPESLFARVAPGAVLRVVIRTLDAELEAEVEEVVPYADSRSRTFLVKASLPFTEGLYPGMFGTLRIPIGTRPAVWVPENGIRRMGQLDLVYVEVDGRWERRFVTRGERLEKGMVEILSGLSGGERVGLMMPEERRP
ncbi:efflux RND transporter periplasmic adaptor subunit [Desulfobotulus sp. H1]|uniref:Efflux RND transporter periplasmic adaptor subunit n=1 Tax=Desulfobotulus pelophilus TaxID=2823377 RepID=A0ABT3N6V1_9BACT|nr:efflux RND transporter periplasmic adaptor subunit [Desulfobotulus pelophilus]MCW7753178.1 efflux RND transporter periplasmic adaptor subunit [Desulfobotulus pelophilus]